jgi:Protein of unknown function (DUF3276)
MEEGKGRKGSDREEIFSKVLKAGKRTYFFDVKNTRNEELYLTITESKKRIDDDGRFVYDKHKIFLYREDFEDFVEYLNAVVGYVKKNSPDQEPRSQEPRETREPKKDFYQNESKPISSSDLSTDSFTNISFEDLDK